MPNEDAPRDHKRGYPHNAAVISAHLSPEERLARADYDKAATRQLEEAEAAMGPSPVTNQEEQFAARLALREVLYKMN